jgi:hypothetical protein
MHAVSRSPYYRDVLGADAAERPLAELPTLSKATLRAEDSPRSRSPVACGSLHARPSSAVRHLQPMSADVFVRLGESSR